MSISINFTNSWRDKVYREKLFVFVCVSQYLFAGRGLHGIRVARTAFRVMSKCTVEFTRIYIIYQNHIDSILGI